MPRTRQLAAIMFTDIQGYTAMMQRDEELAIKIFISSLSVFSLVSIIPIFFTANLVCPKELYDKFPDDTFVRRSLAYF